MAPPLVTAPPWSGQVGEHETRGGPGAPILKTWECEANERFGTRLSCSQCQVSTVSTGLANADQTHSVGVRGFLTGKPQRFPGEEKTFASAAKC